MIHRVSEQQQIVKSSSNTDSNSSIITSATVASYCGLGKNVAVKTLFYYMRCSQLEHESNPGAASTSALSLAHERPYLVLPPLVDYLRVSQVHCEHRQGSVVAPEDVLQAARVLLPGLDTPTASYKTEPALFSSTDMDSQACSQRFKQCLGMEMLSTGRNDLVPQALSLLGPLKINSFNEQGLTALMMACIRGDKNTVRTLLDSGANVDIVVPAAPKPGLYSNLLQDVSGWSALSFAVCQKDLPLVQLLLEKGAEVESSSMVCETPLHLAAMMGHPDLVAMLLKCGADPYYSTLKTSTETYGFRQKGLPCSFALAASHGHRTVLHLMLRRGRKGKTEDVLSLADFLAEGRNSSSFDADSNMERARNQVGTLGKAEQKSLQEAMYHAAESRHLEITMDLRNLGIPWTGQAWSQTLAAAHERGKKALVQRLLADFLNQGEGKLSQEESASQEFQDVGLQILLDILVQSKSDLETARQVAAILQGLYGPDAIPRIAKSDNCSNSGSLDKRSGNAAGIDPHYVNNPELSDIQFSVEGKTFYGHRIVLVNASPKFKELLTKRPTSNSIIEIKHVSYDIFELMMNYLYGGRFSDTSQLEMDQLLQLLAAAQSFSLYSLGHLCAIKVTERLNVDNSVEIYKFSRNRNIDGLVDYCVGFFLQILPGLISPTEYSVSDSFRKLIFSRGSRGQDLYFGLLSALKSRLETRALGKTKL